MLKRRFLPLLAKKKRKIPAIDLDFIYHEVKKKSTPKKRGRKSKAEREQWLKEKAEKEANLPLYKKKIESQLTATLAELRDEVL